MVLSLIGPLDNNRVQRILLVAAYAGTQLKVIPITIGCENETQTYIRNCHPLGRVPSLKSDEGYLFETNAIIRYLARTEKLYNLDGSGRVPSQQCAIPYMLYGKSIQEAAEVDAWLDFVLTELDPFIFILNDIEKRQKSNNNNNNNNSELLMKRQEEEKIIEALDHLQEGFHGLERRLIFKRQLRKLMMSGSTNISSLGRGSVSARNTILNNNNNNNNNNNREDMVEDGLSEEEFMTGATPRESTMLRGYHTYNIKTRMEEPQELTISGSSNHPNNNINDNNNNNMYMNISRLSMAGIPSPRPSSQTPRYSTSYTPRRTNNNNNNNNNNLTLADITFLVGDSLTAADLVVASAVNFALFNKRVSHVLRPQFPQLIRFHHAIMRLPLATNVRKSLGVSIN